MVREETVKKGDSNWRQPTRRELLTAAAGATLGFFSALESGFGQSTQPAVSPAPLNRLAHPPWWLERHRPRSQVVEVHSRRVLRASVVDRIALAEMLDRGLQKLTGATSTEHAWRTVLGPAKRILLKFNAVGAHLINTSVDLASVVVEQITRAGHEPESITLVEVPEFLTKRLGTRRAGRGWGPAIPVGRRPEPLAQYLYDADAIVNVSFLKTHQIAGMSACMKNLSHALIRHPARYHDNGCAPYVGQVVGSQEVSSRLRLNIVNAIRLVVDRGPDARKEDLLGYGGLLLAFDPLAADNVALSILATERQRLGLTERLEVRYLASAAEMGLGRWRPADIDRIALEADS